jgi:hypothetical protein
MISNPRVFGAEMMVEGGKEETNISRTVVLKDCREKMMWFEVNTFRGKGERRKGGEMTEDGIEAVSEFVMKCDFGVTNAIEEMIAKGVKTSATEASRWMWGREKGNTEFTTEEESIWCWRGG